MFTKGMTRTDISHRQIPSVRQARCNPQMVTIARAVESVARTNETRYVFATYGAWNISTEVPPSGSYYEFSPQGRWMVER